jgi:hypothetical protein
MSQRRKRRESDNPYIDTIWQSEAVADGTYLVTPDGSWDLITAAKPDGTLTAFITGQATKPTRLPYKKGEKSVVISFAAGAYLPYLKRAPLRDEFIMLPVVGGQGFRLAEKTFPLPTFQNAEALVENMVRSGVLKNDGVVDGVLQGSPKAASNRTVQRHFKATTGLTRKQLEEIRRAQQAVRLLKAGQDSATTAAEAGYYDQPHLTKSLKRLMDSPPSNVDDVNQV